MKAAALKYTVLTWMSGFVAAILLLIPFHAFLTVWLSSLFGHYTALRLWKEALLLLCIIGALYLIATDHKIRFHTLSRRLVWLILAYMALTVVWGLLALNQHDVASKALGYGLIVNLRFLAFFLVTWSVALRLGRMKTNWPRLLYWPAIGVVFVGLLQAFVLPNDFFRHLGYGPNTILPIETINHNPNYTRVFSTLRGANPLGAYLIIPISLVSVWLLKGKRTWFRALFLAAALVVLFFTFSRSAWAGAGISLVVILFLSRLSRRSQQISLTVAAGLVIIGVILTAGFHENVRFQNFVLHTQKNSAVSTTSDQSHVTAAKTGLKELARHAGGNGPGTAGPASYYNTGHPIRIAEDYYIQIGQEVGWLGLFMFLLINAGVGYLLFVRRNDPLALALFASLIGITFINLLSHAWTDDTLAYVWWGLAGITMAPDAKLADTPNGKA